MQEDIHTPSFSAFELRNGLLKDMSNDEFPTKLHSWDSALEFPDKGSTYFGFVYEGPVTLSIEDNYPYTLNHGQYFSSNKPFAIAGGKGIVVERIGYNGMTMVGGKVDRLGRLKYIDGCTDSLLIPPVKLGDPCFNHLHFPTNIEQTQHTHPSMRVGIVAKGKGVCVTPWGNVDLVPGNIFIIHPNVEGLTKATDKDYLTGEEVTSVAGTHSFFTYEDEMDVIA